MRFPKFLLPTYVILFTSLSLIPTGVMADDDNQPEHKRLLKDAEKVEGMIPLYRKGNKLYAELSSDAYRSEFIVLMAIARGIGRDPLYGGMTWQTGDDWVWKFRKVDERVHIIRKNVRFRAKDGTPEATAMKYAYTDSVLFSVPVAAKGPSGGDLVDLTSVFMSDLPQISQVLSGFMFSSSKSTWAEVKGFEDNIELEVAATYASSGARELDSVADSRGVTINVHYSISKLSKSGYQPREADDRIGYFLTVLKDYSKKDTNNRFVRYINRWRLEKADAESDLSPPKKPIVFWLENTIPYKYRSVVRDGILEWNRAFEKAGFVDAIEVRQQPKKAEWDPEDINYNTFRWITSSAGFAMGPSRVNPYTGEILDADIIFDADFLQFWKQDFETFSPKAVASLTGGAIDVPEYKQELANAQTTVGRRIRRTLQKCSRQQAMAHQFALGSTLLSEADTVAREKDMNKLIMQGLKGTVMHEVGHTLGLRHNFKGSTMLSLKEMGDAEATEDTGLLSSIMDYDAVNIAPEGEKQGDYYTTTIGPYDIWAIEYGYTPGLSGDKLAEIASRSGEDDLAFATDEDTRGIDPDPFTNRWDLGKDPIEFAARQTKLVKQLLPNVIDRMINEGDDYSQSRRAFNVLLSTHGRAQFFVSRLVGGLEISRSHKGDEGANAPITVVPARTQRQALKVLEGNVFGEQPFEIPAETYNYLMSTRWSHWGLNRPLRSDYPIHEVILMWQQRTLDQLLSSLTLSRIHDTELTVPAEDDCLTTAELFERLTKIVFAELDDLKIGDTTNRQPAISSPRRNLQRHYLKDLSNIVLGRNGGPEDCRTVAYLNIKNIKTKIDKALENGEQLDTYTEAHLVETSNRIAKVMESRLTEYAP